MYKYRRSACRAATRHDDDDDRRAPVSTFFIVSLIAIIIVALHRATVAGPSRSHGSFLSPTFACLLSLHRQRSRARLIAISAIICPSSSSLAPPTRRFHGEPPRTMRKEEAHHFVLHTRSTTRDRRSRASVVHAARNWEPPSPELSRGAPRLVDSAERRTSPTVCEKARARFPRYPSRVSASRRPLRPARTSGKK